MKYIVILFLLIIFENISAQSTFTYDANGNQVTRTRPDIIQGVTTAPDVSVDAGTAVTLWAAGGIAYLWSTGDTSAQIVVSPPATTTYTVSITCACGTVQANQVTVTVLPLTAAEEAAAQVGFTVSPNPATEYLSVRIALPEAADITVLLCDAAGRELWQRSARGPECLIEQNCRDLPKGQYWVRFRYKDRVYAQPLVVLR